MNPKLAEATRLTREGRLSEAMALIRDTVSGAPAAPHIDPDVIDLAPPGAPSQPWSLRPAAKPRPKAKPRAPETPGRFTSHSFSAPQGRRSYKLYVPQGHDGPLPLVVMLHGCTQTPDDFAVGTRMNALAEEIGFVAVWPEQPQSANMQRCWNWFNTGDQQRGQGEPALIAGITREVMAAQNIDPARVYVAGLSAGGAAAAIMGACYPELYAAIGVHSGLAQGAATSVASAFQAMRQGGSGGPAQAMPAIVFHGDRDATVSPVNGAQVLAQFTPPADPTLKPRTETGASPGGMGFTRIVHEDAKGQPRAEHWLLHGAGHAWSGGSPAGSYTAPEGPDASREMLRFFLAQPAA
ncbi:extracellular catalytic domain type 1 short-chain-length polyhydroxyalkanoate depolymerase [Cereibacter changlensis]|uniref:extracellular catalytic domain type 1 short-chain-length polyhydroxyalkanoate depolymerase n=1 Tax=Cereibacter changlensis TaxID=402884 RepID=UPI0040343F0A